MVWQKPMPGTGKDWRLVEHGFGEQGYSMASLPLRRLLLDELSAGGPAKSLAATLNVLNSCVAGDEAGRAVAALGFRTIQDRPKDPLFPLC
jgi:hypothetical protein